MTRGRRLSVLPLAIGTVIPSSSIARCSTNCDARPLDAGAKSVVRAHEAEIVNVPVDDEGCVTDVDTPGGL